MVLGEPSLLTLEKSQAQALFASLFLAELYGEPFRIQVGFNEPEFGGLDPAASAQQLLLGWYFGSVRLRTTDLD